VTMAHNHTQSTRHSHYELICTVEDIQSQIVQGHWLVVEGGYASDLQ
jgi:hypothetical protein